jgi:hypothetical protein
MNHKLIVWLAFAIGVILSSCVLYFERHLPLKWVVFCGAAAFGTFAAVNWIMRRHGLIK